MTPLDVDLKALVGSLRDKEFVFVHIKWNMASEVDCLLLEQPISAVKVFKIFLQVFELLC